LTLIIAGAKRLVNNLLKGINLYLVAMPGAGKTTVGRLLAKQLGYGFIDTDEVIVKAVGQPISQMFAEQGEAEFRLLESKVLAQICAIQKLVVATGGGIILRRENWSYLHHGLVVWLDAAVDILYSRLVEDTTRPLLQDPDPKAKLRSLLEQRQPLYAQADLRITITEGETPEEISTRVLEAIPSVLKKPDSLPNGC
jgi:shikimate kinase